MNIGEMFVSLGIKGSEKTLGALSGIKTGMGDVASVSLEAKAAILAAVYGFERMMITSAQLGSSLSNFNALTGISTQTLQQYQYAARQVGISNEEVTSSFKSVQQGMERLRMGEGQQKGLNILSGTTGFDINKGLLDLDYSMKHFQKFYNQEKDILLRNSVLRSFNIGEGMMSAFARNAFRSDVLSKAPLLKDSQLAELDRVNTAYSNLTAKIQRAFALFNVRHGQELVSDIATMTTSIIKLADALTVLAEKVHLFKQLGQAVQEAAHLVNLVTKIVDDPMGKKEKNKPSQFSETPAGKAIFGPGGFTEHTLLGQLMLKLKEVLNDHYYIPAALPDKGAAIAPKLKALPQNTTTQNNEINQTFNFQTDGSDHKQVGDATQKAITNTVFQLPNATRGGI